MITIAVPNLIPIINEVNLIDIRSNVSYNNNHIPGAKNIPYMDLMSNPQKYLDQKSKYYIYCQKGVKSYQLSSYLVSLGYDVVSVIGGYESWILER